MAVNLATKFEKKTSELLKAKRKSQAFTNQDYSWTGVESIIVTTLTDPVMGNYDVNGGSNRYGNPTEVEDTQQTFTLSRDRSWSKTIDKKNFQDSMMIRKPGKFLAQATKNVLVLEIDTYVFQSIVTAGEAASRDDIVTDSATSSSNAYSNFVDINADISDNEAPEEGRIAAITADFYNKLKQSTILDASELGLKDRKSGVIGKVDGVKLVRVPSSRMPANTDLIISHPSVCLAPEKLVDYTLHKNPPGISGDQLDYRHRYDAFVDANWVNAIGVHKTA